MFENGAIPIESGGARRQVDLLAIILSLCDMSPTPVVCRSPNAGPTAFGVGCFGVYCYVPVTGKQDGLAVGGDGRRMQESLRSPSDVRLNGTTFY
jgi:hypothetical protein